MYELELLNKSTNENALNVICDIETKNSFDINTIINIHKKIKKKPNITYY